MLLKNNLILYHGSYAKIEKIDLSKCIQGKDFGTGFYLTTDYNQAARFVYTSIAKAVKNKIITESTNVGYVNCFKFTEFSGIRVFDFKKANQQWLHFISGNRKSGLFDEEIKKWQDYDIISGKIANDATNRVITAYMNGIYGAVGSSMADRTAINLLLPNNLTNQICFKTEKSLACLTFVQSKEVKL